jgi:hypothetical protein
MKRFPWILVAFSAMIFGGGFVNRVKPEVQPPTRQAGTEAHETHASASLLGQFRTTVSSSLWVRTDLYLHNGVEMRPLTDQERAAGEQGVGSTDNKHKDLHDDSTSVTVVPAAEHDFRGIFGDVERATKAYKDMTNHSHNSPGQALPLYRLMTWLDPQFIPAWTTGAHVISWQSEPGSFEKAIEFLHEGRDKNPWSVAIPGEIGSVYIRKRRDFESAIKWLEEAIQKSKPEPRSMPEEEFESLQDTYRFLAIITSNRGELAESLQVAREGSKLFPDDVILKRLANPVPYVLRNRESAGKR